MAVNSPASQEVLEKLQQLEGKPDQQTVLQIIQDLEQHQFFTAPHLETVETQLGIRKRIKAVMESAHIEFMDEEVTGRLEALRDHLTAEEAVAEQYAPPAEAVSEEPFSMGEMPTEIGKQEPEFTDTAEPSGNAVDTAEAQDSASSQKNEEEFEDERPEEAPEAAPDYAKACFEVVKNYIESSEDRPAFKKLVIKLIAQYAKKPTRPLENLAEDLQAYLDKNVYRQAEVLEANTPELKKVLEESREWTEKKTREEVHKRKVQLEESEAEKKKITQQLQYVNEDIRSLQEDIKGLPKGASPAKEQIDRLMELRTGEGGQQELRGKLNAIEQKTGTLNKELNMITHGTRNRLKRSRKISAETMVMHIHGFFMENEDMDPVQRTEIILQKTEKTLKAHHPPEEKRHKLRGADKKEVLTFLTSEKGPLTHLPEKARKVMAQVIRLKTKDTAVTKKWINTLADQFSEKERPAELKRAIIALLSHMQGLMDERRFLKMGVNYRAAKQLFAVKKNLIHAYRMYLVDNVKKGIRAETEELSKEERMHEVFKQIDDFNLSLAEAREHVAVDLPDDMKAFLKEHRKNYLTRRAGRGLAAGAWGLTKIFGKGGRFGLGKLYNFVKKHPKGTAKASAFVTACIFLGGWPATSLTIMGWSGWKLTKGLWHRRQRKKGLMPATA
ncbi:hypothetical protein JW752_01900 [Candidatus Peregrinibacteria bacterium]|nr:hypothetical protein [Candidatus Peregrinibacteria bacterium]